MILQLLFAVPALVQAKPGPDLLLTNASVYTANDRQPKAEAVAVNDGKIVFVGSAKDGLARVGWKTKVLDLKGATVLPGMTDSHFHLDGVGEREMTLNL